MSRFRRLRGLLRARVIHASTGGRRLRMELLERRWLFAVDAAAPHDPILGADVVLPAAMGAGAISGIKWSDANGDGNQDPNEPGLPGVTIYLDANGNGTLNDDEQSTVTGQGGAYSFTNLMAGTYVVREVIPAGYAQTFPLQPASNFDIRIVFPDNTLTQEQKDVFTQAAARWEQIIIGDLPAVNLPGFGLVDDLVIEASAPEIDGPGKVLGQAGPRFIRNGSFLPISGEMQFDIDDVEELIEEGQFDEVILHEMGHVLGIGTIWDLLDLLEGDGTPNPSFTGTRATAEYNAIFGANAAGVPVEGNQGGSGTLYAHWDEEALDNELMTGFLNPNQFNPLSRITAASMADLGYQVYLNAADSYSEPSLALLAAPLRPRVEGWVAALDLPLVAVDATEPPAVTLPELSTADFGFWNVTLDDGEMVTAVDFGNRPLPSSIRGTKFNDRNNDGERSAGEPGLEGWTIFLDADGDETLDPGERSTTTDSNGLYAFTNLAPGDYVVAEVLREGWVQTSPGDPPTHAVTLGAGQDLAGVDFGNRTGIISGLVWNDYDGNGVQNETEPGLEGWTVYLDQNQNGVLDSGPTTLPFAGGPQTIADQSTLISEIEVAGLGTVLDVNVSLNIEHGFDGDLDVFLISPGGTRVELFTDVGSFGDNFTNTILDDEATGSIRNGSAPFTNRFRPEGSLAAFDGGAASGAWKLEITDDSSIDSGTLLGWSLTVTTEERSAQTDASGAYVLADLAAGNYSVTSGLPGGWARTFPETSSRYDLPLLAGDAFEGIRFGVRTGSVRGVVWDDQNNDGDRDNGEAPQTDWLVYLDANNNGSFDDAAATLASTQPAKTIPDLGTLKSTLAVSGLFTVDDVNVTLSINHGYIADLDVFLISPAGTRVELFTDLGGSGQNFVNTLFDDEAGSAVIAGDGPFTGSYVPEELLAAFDGENPNGVWTLEATDDAGNDVGTLLGWSITIASHERFTRTDGAGAYVFFELPPGPYKVRDVQKPNWAASFPAGGGYAIALGAAEQSAGLDFGARATVLFGDYDRDGDVDGADFVVWQRGLGGAAAPSGSGADGDGNGSVGAPDLLVWGQGFGRVEGAQAAAAAAAVVAAAETPATDEASLERAFAEFDASALLGPWAYARTPARTAAPKPAPRQAFPALTAGAFRFDPPAPHAARHSAAKRPLGPTNPGEPGVEADLGQGLSGLPTL